MTPRLMRTALFTLLAVASMPGHAATGRTAGSFAVGANGAANYTIPLWTPPGVNGLQASLALVYNSGRGNGLLGVGWGVTSLSAVSRCPKTWAQDGTPAAVALQVSDGYCLDGQRLRLKTGDYGVAGSTYRTELESFSRITAVGSGVNGPLSFEVKGKDGLTYEYGNTDNSRIEAGGVPSGTPRTWALNKITDRSGNSIQFVYTEDTSNGTYRIDTIDYPYTAANGGPYYRVKFGYEAANRPDILKGYVAGYAWQEPKRLDYIDVLRYSDSVQLRRYDVSWQTGTATGRSRIASITECVNSVCLASTTIAYQNGSNGWPTQSEVIGLTIPTMADAIPMDINGDGAEDLVYADTTANQFHVVYGSAGAGLEVGEYIEQMDADATNYQDAVPLDFNSDGYMDLLIPHGTNWRVLQSTGTNFTPLDSVGYNGTSTVALPTDGAAGNAWVADYNGDGRPDLIYAVNPGTTNSQLLGRRNTDHGFSTTTDLLFQGDCATRISTAAMGPKPVRGRTSRRIKEEVKVLFMDLSGDGRSDMTVKAQNWTSGCTVAGATEWLVFISNGTTMVPTHYSITSSTPPIPADMNGDGLTDLLYPGTSKWMALLSKGNGGMAAPITTSVDVGDVSRAMVADWDGDGRTDLITNTSASGTYYYSLSSGSDFAPPVSLSMYSSAIAGLKIMDTTGDGEADWVYVDGSNNLKYRIHGQTHPDLATSFTDGYGINQSPHYVSIAAGAYSKYGLDTVQAQFPYVNYKGPILVVDTVTASSGNGGNYTQTYYYEGAWMNLQGRGFMGFSLQTTIDSRDGLYHRRSFRQDFPYTGMTAQTELRHSESDNTVVTTTVNTLQKLDVSLTANQEIYYPYIKTSVTDVNEFGGTRNGLPVSKQTTTADVVDSYGNPTTVTVTRQDTDATSPWSGDTFKLQTVSLITNDATNWCLGRPYQTTVTSTLPDNTPLTRTRTATIDYTHCRASDQTVEPNSSTLKVFTSYGFDGCGNLNSTTVTGRKPDGTAMTARTSLEDFGTRCQLPVSLTNALSQATGITNNYDLGLPETVTDPNGIHAETVYDAFGRPTDITRLVAPRHTWIVISDCNANNSYCGAGGSDVRWMRTEHQLTASSAPIRTDSVAYDGLNRPRYLITELPGGGTSKVTRTYDALGRLEYEIVPTTGSIYGSRHLTYDLLGRLTAEALNDNNAGLVRQTTVAYAGRKVTTTDPLAHATDRYIDVRGQLRRVVEPSPGGTANYAYDHFGNLIKVTDAGGVETRWFYNLNGVLTTLVHPDRGYWSFTPNSLGELVSQTDAKNQTMTMTYDALSRPLTRGETEGTTTWTWDMDGPNGHNFGRLTAVQGPGYGETYSYDSRGRPYSTVIAADNGSYTYSYQYAGPTEQLSSTTYPISTSGYQLQVQYDYDAGVLNKISDSNSATIFWQRIAGDARGNAIDESLGNGVKVISSFDEVTGLMEYRTAGTAPYYSNRQNLSFEWYADGSLKKRTDTLQGGLNEQFFYDAVNRLDYSQRNGVTNLDVNYDANGNINYRSDYPGGAGNFGYSSTRPHAVVQVGGNCGNCCSWVDAFSYDANGNMTARYPSTGGSSVTTWYSYNLPNTINLSTSWSQFFYKPDRGRWKQVANYLGVTETTVYLGGLLEKMTRGSVTEYRHYIPAGPSSVAIYTRRTNGNNSTYYTTRDHLGSSAVTMDNTGATLVNLSFGAFGSRRGAAWNDVPSTADQGQIAATSRQGFTGHEHLDNVGVIHMNGRVYDPQLGRFMSADPVYAGNLANPQSLNPYSYVNNSPLSATDPSGLMGDFTSDFHAAQLLDNALDDYLAAIDTYKNNVIACSKNPDCSANGGMSQFDVPSVEGVIAAGNAIIALNRQQNEQEDALQEARQEAVDKWAEEGKAWRDQKQSREFWEGVARLSEGNGGPFTVEAPEEIVRMRADPGTRLAEHELKIWIESNVGSGTGSVLLDRIFRVGPTEQGFFAFRQADGSFRYQELHGSNGYSIDVHSVTIPAGEVLVIMEHTHGYPWSLGFGFGQGPSADDLTWVPKLPNTYFIIQQANPPDYAKGLREFLYYGLKTGP